MALLACNVALLVRHEAFHACSTTLHTRNVTKLTWNAALQVSSLALLVWKGALLAGTLAWRRKSQRDLISQRGIEFLSRAGREGGEVRRTGTGVETAPPMNQAPFRREIGVMVGRGY